MTSFHIGWREELPILLTFPSQAMKVFLLKCTMEINPDFGETPQGHFGGKLKPTSWALGLLCPSWEFSLGVSAQWVSVRTKLAGILCPSPTTGICSAEQSDYLLVGHHCVSQNYSLNITFAYNPAFATSLEVPVTPLTLASLSAVRSSRMTDVRSEHASTRVVQESARDSTHLGAPRGDQKTVCPRTRHLSAFTSKPLSSPGWEGCEWWGLGWLGRSEDPQFILLILAVI